MAGQSVFRDLVHLAASVTNSPIAFVAFPDRGETFAYGIPSENIHLSQALFTAVGSASGPFLVPIVQDSPFRSEPFFEGQNACCFIAVALTPTENNPPGMLAVIRRENQAFTESEMENLCSLARIGAAIHSLQADSQERARLENLFQEAETSYRYLMEASFRDIAERERKELRLAAQHSATRVLAESDSFQEAAPLILEAICRSLDWDLGQFWMIDQPSNTLRLVELWHDDDALVKEFEAVSRATSFLPGIGLPGRVWANHEPAWIPDVVYDANFPRAPYARKVGLHGAFAFPILLGKEFLGTMEFFSHEIREPDPELLQMFASIGSQIGQYVSRKKAEESRAQLLKDLEYANQELKDFAYIVSHDLKAPLRAIASLSNWLATDYSDKLDEDGKEQLQLLVSRVKRMHALIDGILQYSRVAKQSQPPEKVNLHHLVEDVIQSLGASSNVAIHVRDPLPTVNADPIRMQQIFQNLLSNAIKYMDKTQGVIAIRCLDDKGIWKFSVSDNGPGIEEKYFDRIFQLFQTLAARDEVESTGVGLAVVKKIVELYGGRIGVESKKGEGAVFTFTIPKTQL